MSPSARRYFLPPAFSFWRWADGGEAVTWEDGETIAFRGELLQVLSRLAPDGLPPFSALLLLLAATRESWSSDSGKAGLLRGIASLTDSMDGAREEVSETARRLDRIRSLPGSLRASLQAREVLAETVFQASTGKTTPRLAAEIVQLLEHGLGEEVLSPILQLPHEVRPSALQRDMRIVRLGVEGVDAQALALRLLTGLDETPRPIDCELLPAERVRSLLAELEGDGEHSGLAQLTRNLMAAVTLPRPMSAPADLPLGGFSDIANRGSLDRLLLSELANDHLTLAVRVAMNEALYLRREAPPRTPPRQRAMLLDCGIRCWGVPRVFATSVALAMAATGGQGADVAVYRAEGGRATPIDLTARSGLLEHLAALDTGLHPGAALAAFVEAIERSELASECVVITTEDAAEDPEFLGALSKLGPTACFLATVNREGRLRLWERSPRGSKLIREALLKLEDLTPRAGRSHPPLLDRAWARDLPAILSVAPFPLRLTQSIESDRLWLAGGRGALGLTKDRRLMFWDSPGIGGLQLSDCVPPGRLWWGAREGWDGGLQALVGHNDPRGFHLLQIDFEQRRCELQPLSISGHPRSVCNHNGGLFVVFATHVQVVHQSTGEALQRFELPSGARWISGRFFLHEGYWCAVSYNGRTALLEKVLAAVGSNALLLFDCEGVDGPLALTRNGHILETATRKLRRVQYDPPRRRKREDVECISRDGQWIVLGGETPVRDVVNVKTLSVEKRWGDQSWMLEREARGMIRQRSLRRRFLSIGVNTLGELILESKRQRFVAIRCNPTHGKINWVAEVGQLPMQRRTFKKSATPPSIGFKLSVATWDDGSQAFLDSRGLLHLKSSAAPLPQVTLVLDDQEISGWSADGRTWGVNYYVGQATASPEEIFNSILKPFAARL